MNKICIISLLVFFIASIKCICQDKKLSTDSSYDDIFEYYQKYLNKDSIKSIYFIDLYANKAEKEENSYEYLFAKDIYYVLSPNDEKYLTLLDSMIINNKKIDSIIPANIYMNKADFYLRNKENDLALDNYLNALSFVEKSPNLEFELLIKQRLGLLKSRLNQTREAIRIYLDLYDIYQHRKIIDNEWNLISLMINLSVRYATLKKFDSASYFNKKAHSLALKTNYPKVVAYSIYQQGILEFENANYQAAIDSLKKSVKVLIDDNSFSTAIRGYAFLARSYLEIEKKELTLKNYFIIDSLASRKKIYSTYTRESQAFLMKYYKYRNEYNKQLIYLEKLIITDSLRNSRKRKFQKALYYEYDKPKLLKERNRIIKKLENKLNKSNNLKIGLTGISFIILFFLVYQYQERKKLKLRFQKLQKNTNLKSKEKEEIISKVGLNIPDDVVKTVLSNLNVFERNIGFLATELSLHSLANDLNTNANYLSKIINHYKEVGFSQYINDLRITYLIELLNSDSKIRRYSIKGISEELGYKNAESFSKAFYKKTGLKPSYFIKQLEKAKKQ